MDSRFIFLHYNKTELRGRMGEAQAGNGKSGASAEGVRKEKPPYKTKDVKRSEMIVAKCVEPVPRKAAIAFIVPVP